MIANIFHFSSPDTVSAWASIDDRVMGGCSTSCLRYDPQGHAIFEGTVRADNNGGFASIRTRAVELNTKIVGAFVLKVNGDGKRYKFNLRMDDNFDGVTYQTAFVSTAGVWTSVLFPVSQFTATRRGRPVSDAPALNPALVRQMGLMIGDRQLGGFSLKVAAIGTESTIPI
jgi:hypothetical protein